MDVLPVQTATCMSGAMGLIAQGATAGLIAALVATTIFGLARYLRQAWDRHQDVKDVRDILSEGRRRVMESKDTYNRGMGETLPGDVLRAAQYNNMLKRVEVALERWSVNLSHDQRKDIYEALDWYNIDALQATKNREGAVEFLQLPEGRWHTTEMSKDFADDKFMRLQSIKWLKLKPD